MVVCPAVVPFLAAQGETALKFFVSCARGLEYLLADELLALGCARATAAVAGVNAEGDPVDAQRAVLWSRLASRVLWPLTEYACLDDAQLYAGARALPWPQHLQGVASIAVDAHVSGDVITHARYAAQRIKDAVVDAMREHDGSRPDVDLQSPDLRLNLVVRKGRAVLSVDMGGGPLHRRGWRRAQHDAPLKETLAAAVLVRGGWPKRYREGGALADPMCGGGTLLIEGALMAADVAPGLQRHGDALPTQWPGFDRTAWQRLRDEASQRAETGLARLRPVFWGSDYDPDAIHAASQNASAAGLAGAIRFEPVAVQSLPPALVPWLAEAGIGPDAPGLAVCNPPYDARLSADAALYRALGQSLQQAVPGWAASILCGDEELAFATGLRARRRYRLFNGALECVLIVSDPVATLRPADGMPFNSSPRTLSDGARMVANRLRKNLKALRNWTRRDAVTCYRVYDADIPEYAAAIDLYTEADAPHGLWLHVQEYAAPAEIPETLTRRRLDELLAAAREVFELPRDRVAIKTRRRGKGGSKYGHFDARGEFIAVREGDARLQVNLFDHLDTGLFLDHRPLRLRIAAEARGRHVLNLFCYTGAASVHAAVGGAAGTTSVDLSGTYLEWLGRNLRENGIGGSAHRLEQADALQWLEAERGRYDLIFCDPPTFSNSARASDFDIQRDHLRLLQAAVARLSPDGVLYFSNNFRRFRLDEAGVAGFALCEEISAATIPPDFARNPRIHRAWELRRRGHG